MSWNALNIYLITFFSKQEKQQQNRSKLSSELSSYLLCSKYNGIKMISVPLPLLMLRGMFFSSFLLTTISSSLSSFYFFKLESTLKALTLNSFSAYLIFQFCSPFVQVWNTMNLWASGVKVTNERTFEKKFYFLNFNTKKCSIPWFKKTSLSINLNLSEFNSNFTQKIQTWLNFNQFLHFLLLNGKVKLKQSNFYLMRKIHLIFLYEKVKKKIYAD